MSKVIDNIIIKLGRSLCERRQKKPFSTIGQIVKTLAYAYENHNYNCKSNGEERVIEIMSRFTPKVAIDAGANVGEWFLTAKKYFKEITIHAFKITPDTFAELKKRCAAYPEIIINQIGLDEQEGQIRINKGKDASWL